VVGHRGAAGLEPENTLRSFRRAIELGVDLVECDVRLTADGAPVLLHDETLDRTTDGRGPVAGTTLEALRNLDAGKGERVPTLSEFLALISGRCGAHLELKADGTPAVVLEVVEREGMLESIIFTSGRTERLAEVRQLCGEASFEHIFSDPPPDAIPRALSVCASRISVNHNHLTTDFVRAAHDAGLVVVTWTPNTEEEMVAGIEKGVDFVCTDRPDILLRLLGR